MNSTTKTVSDLADYIDLCVRISLSQLRAVKLSDQPSRERFMRRLDTMEHKRLTKVMDKVAANANEDGSDTEGEGVINVLDTEQKGPGDGERIVPHTTQLVTDEITFVSLSSHSSRRESGLQLRVMPSSPHSSEAWAECAEPVPSAASGLWGCVLCSGFVVEVSIV